MQKKQSAASRAALYGIALSVQDRESIPRRAPSAQPIDGLLSRLGRAKQTGPGRWIARCPSHNDRSPSLSIRETDDGTVLLKCWTGCSAADVMAACGLTLADLFPAPRQGRGPLRPSARWIPHDVLRCLAAETLVVLVAAEAVGRGQTLSTDDMERLSVAASRFWAAAREVGHE